MSTGRFKSPQFSAVFAYDPVAVRKDARAHVLSALEFNDFDAKELAVHTPAMMTDVVKRARDTADLLVYMATPPVTERNTRFDAFAATIERPLPGVTDLVRNVALEAGYSRALFETLAAGWVGNMLAVAVPNNTDVVSEVFLELLPYYGDLLDPTPVAGGDDEPTSLSRRSNYGPGGFGAGPGGFGAGGSGAGGDSVAGPRSVTEGRRPRLTLAELADDDTGDTLQTDPASTHPASTDPARTDSEGTDPAKAYSASTHPAKANPAKTDSEGAASEGADPAKTGPANTDTAKILRMPPRKSDE